MLQVSRQELETVLEKLLELMMKNNLMPAMSGAEKKELISQIAQTLERDRDLVITKDSLTDRNALQSLCASLVAAHDPKNTFNYTELFKTNLELTVDAKMHLKQVLTPVLTMKAGKDAAKLNELKTKLDEHIDELVKVLDKNIDKDRKHQITRDIVICKIIEERLRDQRISDYGVDSHEPGAVLKTVQYITGNLTGRADLSTHGDNAMAKSNDPNSGEPDPLGKTMIALTNSLMDGVISPGERHLLDALRKNDISVTGAPRLTPGNGDH